MILYVVFELKDLSVCLLGKEAVRTSISGDLQRRSDPLHESTGPAGRFLCSRGQRATEMVTGKRVRRRPKD